MTLAHAHELGFVLIIAFVVGIFAWWIWRGA
jgi:hypothetical protein